MPFGLASLSVMIPTPTFIYKNVLAYSRCSSCSNCVSGSTEMEGCHGKVGLRLPLSMWFTCLFQGILPRKDKSANQKLTSLFTLSNYSHRMIGESSLLTWQTACLSGCVTHQTHCKALMSPCPPVLSQYVLSVPSAWKLSSSPWRPPLKGLHQDPEPCRSSSLPSPSETLLRSVKVVQFYCSEHRYT